MKTLLLTLEYPSRASYYDDWRDAFLASPLYDVECVNIFDAEGRRRALLALKSAELTVILHSCNADTLDYLTPLKDALAGRKGQLASFVGNELNIPWAPLSAKIAFLKAIRPDLILTQLPLAAGQWVYEGAGAPVMEMAHALNPDAYQKVRGYQDRPVDIGARSWKYQAWLGDDDRNRLFALFRDQAFDPPLTLDMSTDHRFDRAGWAAFLNSCKGTLATEAGSWFLERDDATVLAIRDYARAKAGGVTLKADSALHRIARRLPWKIKAALKPLLGKGLVKHEALAAEHLDYSDVYEIFFKDKAKPPVYAKAISSRHFDAIGCGTVQVMIRGRFNGILAADTHYIALDPDFGNLDAALARFRDPAERRRIAEAALAHVRDGHTHAHRVAALAAALQSARTPAEPGRTSA